jgi:photoactive yellow protein
MSGGIRTARFGSEDVANRLSQLSVAEFDELAFGLIGLDREGTVQAYNSKESQLAGRTKAEVMGQRFFEVLAPCACTVEFQGRYQDVSRGKLDSALFEYTFDYRMNPRRVFIHIKRTLLGDGVWILVRPRTPSMNELLVRT